MSEIRVRDSEEHKLVIGPSFAIGAYWREDRWMTFFGQVPDGKPFLEVFDAGGTRDGGAEANLPAPVFQHCHVRGVEQYGELLFLGQFGHRHFSGAWVLGKESSRFEVAERWISAPESMRIRWRWTFPESPTWVDTDCFGWEACSGGWRAQGEGPFRLAIDESGIDGSLDVLRTTEPMTIGYSFTLSPAEPTD